MYHTTICAPNLVSPSPSNAVVLMPATLQVYIPPSKAIVPNETLVIIDAKFSVSLGPIGILAQLNALSFKPFNNVSGLAPDVVDYLLPDFKAYHCHLLGVFSHPVPAGPAPYASSCIGIFGKFLSWDHSGTLRVTILDTAFNAHAQDLALSPDSGSAVMSTPTGPPKRKFAAMVLTLAGPSFTGPVPPIPDSADPDSSPKTKRPAKAPAKPKASPKVKKSITKKKAAKEKKPASAPQQSSTCQNAATTAPVSTETENAAEEDENAI
ncbi:hypothetical protein EST38_g13663 [Candolleomyces aberdarensis]|uniref:Uncharacterized protein n=1 Tax=Candolleomyces aberdarensis TaxID=2316362 RepID=A0A4Q2D1N2_9AGAR|nr:hypothetical protein EST38_g13663 [Candolleomyces aberdarensis]